MTETTRRERLGTEAKALQDSAFALLESVKDEDIFPLIYARFMHYEDVLIFKLTHSVRPSQEDSLMNETEAVLRAARKEFARIEQAIRRAGGPSSVTAIGLAAVLPRPPVKWPA